jgi:hypothetical protein
VVPPAGLEPACPKARDFKSDGPNGAGGGGRTRKAIRLRHFKCRASTSFATPACHRSSTPGRGLSPTLSPKRAVLHASINQSICHHCHRWPSSLVCDGPSLMRVLMKNSAFDQIMSNVRAEVERAYAEGYAAGLAEARRRVENAFVDQPVGQTSAAKSSLASLFAAPQHPNGHHLLESSAVCLGDLLTRNRAQPADRAFNFQHVRGISLRHAFQGSMCTESDRAPKGAAQAAIENVLTSSPGLTAAQIEGLGQQYDCRLNPKSIGNELRRGAGTRYMRDDKGCWSLSNTHR